MILRLVTPPATEPVTLAQAKAHLRIEHVLDDAQITALIVAARRHIEASTWRGLVTQTWEAVLPTFPAVDSIELPKGGVVSVASVKYLDASGVEQTLSTGDYETDLDSAPGRVILGYGKFWPSTRPAWDAVRVRYTVGWADDAVPEPITQAMLLLVGAMYEFRTPEILGTTASKVGVTVDALIAPYKLRRF